MSMVLEYLLRVWNNHTDGNLLPSTAFTTERVRSSDLFSTFASLATPISFQKV